MDVASIMTNTPLYIHPEMSVPDALAFLKKEGIGRVPVLDQRNHLIGIITERDLLNASPSSATALDIYEINYLLSKLKVEKVMKRDVITITEDVAVEEAARIMVDNKVSALPVMRGDALVGIVSDGDLFKLFINLFGAREEGVRITLLLKEGHGVLKHITAGIADAGGNIITMVIRDGSSADTKICLIKINGVSKETAVTILSPLAAEILDVR
ncbi:CBS domain-containing protein [Treponema phagedenis]|uniref:CBS domain protein n=2 Tax=Treponema phagedenis TaxID=162 RepID=A0A0B7H1T4_TREPH|nr:CBS domain-containing protein [Treponema phagedenis]NVP23320.1 CBS domain-containing protein [Treponema phagedenis]QEJ95536.1 CBS domain-containing protein [Treponema phagedenis]QEJ99641.1 CBS domain-containing protein [Treponema phagedenis]QEK02275.1 CBS domain-containing protein [Treponema phagedenis]QEK05192.1 CBS domain-containing protein [Treponema phagedenis]